MRKSLFFLLILMAFIPSALLAQEGNIKRVTGNFQNLSIPQFFAEVEKQTAVKFYYDLSKLDSVKISIVANDKPLSELLKEALKSTDLQFSIDSRNNVFITKRQGLVMDLPKNLFEKSGRVADNQDLSADSLAMFDIETKKGIKNTNTVIVIGSEGARKSGNVVLTGYVRNSQSGEPLANASVFVDNSQATITDQYGHYSLALTPGKHILNIQTLGMRDTRLQLMVYSTGKLDVDMYEQIRVLREIKISGYKSTNIRNSQMGVDRLTIESIKRIPSVFGETDVLRAITTLPGVKTVGEASTGFNVRGGSADQNLILLNDATVYNPSHFFGMFSAFNPEIIQNIELYKSSIPAKYGGRLSSVLDITNREGNKKKITGSAGIGIVTSRFNLEGPLIKDKTSFIIGARTTYSDWLINQLPDEYKNSRANFQDYNLAISHRIDSSNSLYLTGYYSNDKFSFEKDTTYRYNNGNINLKWKHNFADKFTGIFTVGYDQYKYSVVSERSKPDAYKLGFDISQINFKAHFDYYINTKHAFDFGLSSIKYKLRPGYVTPVGDQSLVTPDEVSTEQALESALYFTYKYSPSNKWQFNTGIRYSMFNYLGPQQVKYYAPGVPLTESSVVETKEYDKGDLIKTYHGPEVRFSIRYAPQPDFSIKASYNSLRQYIHLLSNTTVIAPTDIWKLSDPNIKPQLGDQLSLGFYKNFAQNTVETSIEVYYKRLKDYLDYKPGATLIMNKDIEQEVISTKGKAYGIEFLIKKPGGKLNGWIGYTYSRILLRAYDSTQGALVNNGAFYPANYDKPHDVTMTGNYRISHRFSVSINMTYSTGRPITLPIGRYYYGGSQRVLYSDRNSYRIPDYFRMDFAVNIDGNHKVKQKTHNSWSFGLYNLTGRKNPYSVYFVSENGTVQGYKFSIFGTVIPFINFNIRF